MKNPQINKQIHEVNDEVYYQKLSLIISQLNSWLSHKNLSLTQHISDQITQLTHQQTAINTTINEYCYQLNAFLCEISDLTSKVPFTIRNKKKNSQIKISQNNQKNYFASFTQKWREKKEKLAEIDELVMQMSGEIKRKLEQKQKLHEEFISQSKKQKNNQEWSSSQYYKKFEIASQKSQQKYFEIKKIEEAKQIFAQQSNYYEEFVLKIQYLKQKKRENNSGVLQYLQSNIVVLIELLNSCFGDFGKQILQELNEMIKYCKKISDECDDKCIKNKETFTKQIIILKQEMNFIIQGILEEISVASWGIEFKTGDQNQFSPKKGVITIDNKFLVIDILSNQSKVNAEINLKEVTLKQIKQLNELVLKPKKKSSTSSQIIVKFQKGENQEEFKLHTERAKGSIQ